MAQQMETAAINFDQETLRSLGINPDVSNYFSRKTKYLPGSVSVALKVNGDNKGNVIARFDNNGDLCFDKPFMEQAGLKFPLTMSPAATIIPVISRALLWRLRLRKNL